MMSFFADNNFSSISFISCRISLHSDYVTDIAWVNNVANKLDKIDDDSASSIYSVSTDGSVQLSSYGKK